MNIFINKVPKTTAWGGGNKTVEKLTSSLIGLGHTVINNITAEQINDINKFNELNIDVIFCFDPRPNHQGIAYNNMYFMKKHFNAKLFHRIGDIGTHGKPELLELQRQSSKLSDFLIFPSMWACNNLNSENKNYKVIENSPKEIFYDNRNVNDILEKNKNIRLVTHHWSNNPKKGFDTYSFLDENLGNSFKFTYIGRLPAGLKFKNASHIKPLSGPALAKELSSHDIYLTASKEEAGANHVLEAMACGLPVVYHDKGGSINEYVGNRGLSFDSNSNVVLKLNEAIENFDIYKRRNIEYGDTIDQTIQEYYELICKV